MAMSLQTLVNGLSGVSCKPTLVMSTISLHVRCLAAEDEGEASACFHSLLQCLEEQRERSLRENTIIPGPDYVGMTDYLLVRCTILGPPPTTSIGSRVDF